MSNFYQTLKKASVDAIKSKDSVTRQAIALIIGELERDPYSKPPYQDSQVVKVLTKIKKNLDEVVARGGLLTPTDLKIVHYAEGMLPKAMSPTDVQAEVDRTIDQYPDVWNDVFDNPNKIGRLVGIIMKSTGGAADPNLIKQEINRRIANERV